MIMIVFDFFQLFIDENMIFVLDAKKMFDNKYPYSSRQMLHHYNHHQNDDFIKIDF